MNLKSIEELLEFLRKEDEKCQERPRPQQEFFTYIKFYNHNDDNEQHQNDPKTNLDDLKTNFEPKILLTHEIIEILNSNRTLDLNDENNSDDKSSKNEFIDHIQKFGDISIEIEYDPNYKFEDIYRKVLKIKSNIYDKLKICIYINNTNTTNDRFKNNPHISSVVFGPNVVTIRGGYGVGSFEDCSSLEEIKLGRNVNRIEGGAFNLCVRLHNFEIPKSVKFIDNSSFCSCCNLTEITIPSTVQIINSCAFKKCTQLSKITVDPYQTEMKNQIFEECPLLQHFIFSNTVNIIKPIGNDFIKQIKIVTIPPTVTTIEKQSFDNFTSLEQITIPPSVTMIGTNVFSNCSCLEQISIPSSLYEQASTYGISKEATIYTSEA